MNKPPLMVNLGEERMRRLTPPGDALVNSALFALREMRTELDAIEDLLHEHLRDLRPATRENEECI